MWISLLTVTILLLSWVIYFYLTRNVNYWKNKKVPYLQSEFFFGNIRDAIFLKLSMGEVFQTLYNKSKEPYFGFFLLDKPSLMIRDPKLIKTITTTDFQYFTDRTTFNNKRDDPVGSHILFALKNPDWKNMRQSVRPIFSMAKLKNLSVLIEECAVSLMEHLEEVVGEEVELDAKSISMSYTVDTITSCCFGIKTNSYDKNSKFKQVAQKLFDWDDLWLALQMRCYFFSPTLVKLFHMKLLHGESTRFLKKSFLDIMQQRSISNATRNDVIDMLIHLRKADASLADDDILVATAVNFFIAGYETTSASIAFGLYELAKNPEYQKRLQEEIQQLKDINLETVKDLPYLDMCVKEILRKYPSLPFLDRTCNASYQLPDTDIVIEEGTKVFVSLLGLHYDPEHFPDPETFNPDRFAPGAVIPDAYLPFGNGPRFCIGDRFGLMAVKIGICNILRKYNACITDKSPSKIVYNPKSLLLSSAEGVPLKFVKRH